MLFASEGVMLGDLPDFRAFDALEDLGMSKSFAEPPRARARAPEGRPGKRTSRGSTDPDAATEPSSLVTCEGINAPRPLPKAACFVAALPEPARLLFSFTIMTSIDVAPLFHVKQSHGIPRRPPVHDRYVSDVRSRERVRRGVQLDSVSQKFNLRRRVESRALPDDEADLEDGPSIGWEEDCGQCDEQLNPEEDGAIDFWVMIRTGGRQMDRVSRRSRPELLWCNATQVERCALSWHCRSGPKKAPETCS